MCSLSSRVAHESDELFRSPAIAIVIIRSAEYSRAGQGSELDWFLDSIYNVSKKWINVVCWDTSFSEVSAEIYLLVMLMSKYL